MDQENDVVVLLSRSRAEFSSLRRKYLEIQEELNFEKERRERERLDERERRKIVNKKHQTAIKRVQDAKSKLLKVLSNRLDIKEEEIKNLVAVEKKKSEKLKLFADELGECNKKRLLEILDCAEIVHEDASVTDGNGNKSYKCLCGKRVGTFNSLKSHIYYAKIGPLKCPICGQTYARMSLVNKHLKTCQ